MHVGMYAHAHTYIYLYIHVRTHTHTCIYIYIHTHTQTGQAEKGLVPQADTGGGGNDVMYKARRRKIRQHNVTSAHWIYETSCRIGISVYRTDLCDHPNASGVCLGSGNRQAANLPKDVANHKRSREDEQPNATAAATIFQAMILKGGDDTHIHIHIYIYIHICINIFICSYRYNNMCVYKYVYTYIHLLRTPATVP